MQTAEVVSITTRDPRDTAIEIKRGLQAIANMLTYDITPADVSAVYTQLKNIEDALNDMGKLARDRLLAYIKERGVKISDSGSLKAVFGNYEASAIVRNTGYDNKKVQQMLRSKGLDATAGCDQVITYKANPDKMAALVAAKRVTEEEAAACKMDVEYRVERPTRISDND